jgi:LmbE family N-acetylglucosaminyl deacetylase
MKYVSLVTLLVLSIVVAPARSGQCNIPQDAGAVGLELMLRKLGTTARLMHVTAHPDDEDGGMLTMSARGLGASVLLLTLTRGEGGQNKTGSELDDALGILRTLELLASDRYYGVEQRFTRVADFGFSKSAQETLKKWDQGRQALGDLVRVIREFRPDVLVARFQGSQRDGHGHHQAAGLLAREAFKAAADPNQFPEQIREGLQPWQPKKLYVNNIKPGEDYTIELDVGSYDAALGMSYAQFAIKGLSHQLSQGAGAAHIAPGHRYSRYKLVEAIVPTPGMSGGREQSFFDGIDTTLVGLAARIAVEEPKVPFLRPALIELERKVNEARATCTLKDTASAAAPLLEGLDIVGRLIGQLESSSLSAASKSDLLVHLKTKRDQLEAAANLALGVALEATVDAQPAQSEEPVSAPPPQETFQMAYPGQTFTLTASLYNRGALRLDVDEIALSLPSGWHAEAIKKDLKPLGKDDSASVQFRVTVPTDATYTRPYWYREDPQSEASHRILDHRYLTLPLPPAPLKARACYRLGQLKGEVQSVVQVKYVDPLYGQELRPLAVGPAISVEINPPVRILVAGQTDAIQVQVGVRSNVAGPAKARLKLEVPAGWRFEPPFQEVTLTNGGELSSFKFKVMPGRIGQGSYEVRAVAEHDGKIYSDGFAVVARRDIGAFYHYRPALQRISAIEVKLPRRLKVGYVMGAGDQIPEVLMQIGVDVDLISQSELIGGNLYRFDAIVLGIRAYDVRSDVRDNNRRLLEYVARGGTLIVQYNQNVAAFNAGRYTPYPATASNARVSAEDAPLEILDPKDSVFNYPNRITRRDFDGWVQERGTYFMSKWDERFKPLLESHDPGEQKLLGGLLRAQYGRGVYIFTGYAFFRQLPAGVPGAIRLFVNLLSAGLADRRAR